MLKYLRRLPKTELQGVRQKMPPQAESLETGPVREVLVFDQTHKAVYTPSRTRMRTRLEI